MNFLIQPDQVLTEKKKLSKSKTLVKIAHLLSDCEGTLKGKLDWKQIFHQITLREKEGNTYIDNGVALPHMVYNKNKNSMGNLVVIRLRVPIHWYADSPPVLMVWGLLSPQKHHLQILKDISGIISNPQLTKKLCFTSPKNFVAIIKRQVFPTSQKKRETGFLVKKFLSHCHYHEKFLLPPGLILHARPATNIVELVKSLPGDFFFVTSKGFAHADSITDILALSNSIAMGKSLILAVRYSPSEKKFLRSPQFSFNQIKATLMTMAFMNLDSMNTVSFYKKKGSLIPTLNKNTMSSSVENSVYERLIREAHKQKSLFPVEILATRYNFQSQGSLLDGPLLFYERTTIPKIFPLQDNHDSRNHSSLENLKQITIFKKAVKIVVNNIEKTLQPLNFYSDTFNSIMKTHIQILKDKQLHNTVKSQLSSLNKNSPTDILLVWDKVINEKIKSLKKKSSLISHIADWQDIGRKIKLSLREVLYQQQRDTQKKAFSSKKKLTKQIDHFYREQKQPIVLACDEIYPSEVIELINPIKKGKLLAIIMGNGNRNSHAAIMLTNLSLPVVFFSQFNKYNDFLRIVHPPLTQVLVDLNGFLILRLNNKKIEKLILEWDTPTLLSKHSLQPIPKPKTNLLIPDLPDISFYLNINNQQEIDIYQEKKKKYPYNQIKGVGLVRTELFFLGMKKKPSMVQQINLYKHISKVFHPLPIVIRTLDLSIDKPVVFLSSKNIPSKNFQDTKKIDQFTEREKMFLQEQIESILVASVDYPNIKLLFPMVTSLEDFFIYYRLLHDGMKKTNLFSPPNLGVMIESPSLIFQLERLNQFVDFYSIGGNDLERFLTLESRHQFSKISIKHLPLILAIEKILSMIKDKPITFCGNQASNPFFLGDFIAAGLKHFSIPVSGIEQLSQLSLPTEKNLSLTQFKNYLF